MYQKFRYLRIHTLAFTALFLICACNPAIAESKSQWTYLSQANLPSLQKQLQQKYTNNAIPIDVGRMRVLAIEQNNKSLYLIDTRVSLEPNRRQLNPTCGAAGCSIMGYLQTGKSYQEVLSIYLDPVPPPGKSLIEPTATLQNGLPCLNFNQRKIKTRQTEVVQWCYDGQRYQFVNSTLQQQ